MLMFLIQYLIITYLSIFIIVILLECMYIGILLIDKIVVILI